MTVGVNYKTAPLVIREKLAFDRQMAVCCAQKLLTTRWLSSVAIVSTCNRTEFYCEDLDPDRLQDFWHWLKAEKQLSPQMDLAAHTYQYDNESAVEHILRVATGLDSLVLGEAQVLGQVKAAYHSAREAGTLGKGLTRLFQFVLGAAKRIRTQTAIGVNPLSIAHIAMRLLKSLFPESAQLRVLLIGSGEMVLHSARQLQQMGVARLMFVNRTKSKAQALAQEFQGQAFCLASLADALRDADVVVSATACPVPLLSRTLLELVLKVRPPGPMLLLDLAVPRDVEASVASLPDICLYTIDDLQSMALDNRLAREQAAAVAEALVSLEVRKFMRWLHERATTGHIQAFRDQCTVIRETTVQEALAQLQAGKSPEVVVQRLGHRLTNRLIHHPTIALRTAELVPEFD